MFFVSTTVGPTAKFGQAASLRRQRALENGGLPSPEEYESPSATYVRRVDAPLTSTERTTDPPTPAGPALWPISPPRSGAVTSPADAVAEPTSADTTKICKNLPTSREL